MKTIETRRPVTVLLFAAFMFLLIAPLALAQPETQQGLPSISQQLVREGEFAVQLHAALGLGTVDEEAEAESGLGQVGILPRNGWIADYPVTPDVLGELRESLRTAVSDGKIPLGADEALRKLDQVAAQASLAITPQAVVGGEAAPDQSPAVEDYPNPAAINEYYQTEGPPVVTYYTPPADYYYLYGWIPYPFWCAGIWFPGYFILNDFHRSFRAHNRVFFVSNHFNDVRRHRVFRVDPVSRFNGRTYAGIGVTHRRGFISTGVPRSQRAIFNAPRAQAAPGMRPLRGMRGGDGARPVLGTTRNTVRGYNSATRGTTRTFTAPAQGGGVRTFSAPRGSGGRSFAPAGSGRSASGSAGRSFAPAGAGRSTGGAPGGHVGGGGYRTR